MKNEIEINELIEQYLLGTKDESGKEKLEGLLNENPALQALLEMHRHLHGIINDGALLDIRKELSAIHFSKIRNIRNIKRMTGFGGTGLIMCLALFFTFRNDIPEANTKQTDHMMTPGVFYPAVDSLVIDKEIIDTSEYLPAVQYPVEKEAAEGPNLMTSSPNTETSAIQNEQPPAYIAGSLINSVSDTMTDQIIKNTVLPAEGSRQSDEKIPGLLIDCGKVRISGDLIINASCNNKPSGCISVDMATISGGFPPYSFTIDGKTFTGASTFPSLYPGKYEVYARDSNYCTCLLGYAYIDTEDCTYNAAFAPFRGEHWDIPAGTRARGILTIYSSSGSIVYTSVVNEFESQWNGTTISGQQLPMGLYQFSISYDDGTLFNGTVTIVR